MPDDATTLPTVQLQAWGAIVELRQYTLHPGQRDVLINLFDRAFVESQEALGVSVIGQFRDLDRPDHFVWLRGFTDMPARAEALAAFYGGPVWAAHRSEANATMIDSDDVLLLRPASPDRGFRLGGRTRASVGAAAGSDSLVTVTICHLNAPADDALIAFVEQSVLPEVSRSGAVVAACLVTEAGENTFPALPVRAGEQVLVWISTFASPQRQATCLERLEQSPAWRERIAPELRSRLKAEPEVLRLAPTARSLLRG